MECISISNTLDPRVYVTLAIDANGSVEVEVLFRNGWIELWVTTAWLLRVYRRHTL
jgi:hypothetical protein